MSVTNADNLKPYGTWLYAGKSPGEETAHVASTLSFAEWCPATMALAERVVEAAQDPDPNLQATLTHHQDDERGWTEVSLTVLGGKPRAMALMALTAHVSGPPPEHLAEHFKTRKTGEQEYRERLAAELREHPDNIPTPIQAGRLSKRLLGELLDETEERGNEHTPRAIALRDELLRRM